MKLRAAGVISHLEHYMFLLWCVYGSLTTAPTHIARHIDNDERSDAVKLRS